MDIKSEGAEVYVIFEDGFLPKLKKVGNHFKLE